MTRDRDSSDRTIVYDPETGAYCTSFDPTDEESLVMAVVHAVATLAGVHETDIGPLYRQIDPEALVSLFTAPEQPRPASECSVQFTLHDYTIVVSGDGDIEIYPPVEGLRTPDGGSIAGDCSRGTLGYP